MRPIAIGTVAYGRFVCQSVGHDTPASDFFMLYIFCYMQNFSVNTEVNFLSIWRAFVILIILLHISGTLLQLVVKFTDFTWSFKGWKVHTTDKNTISDNPKTMPWRHWRWALQKSMNWSRCSLGCGLWWAQWIMFQVGARIPPRPGAVFERVHLPAHCEV